MTTMRTVLNVLNFVLGGFFTTLGWLIATFFSVVLIFTLPLTRSCWEITKISLLPFGNEAIHVDELYPEKSNALLAAGGSLLNIVWLVLFGWWLCLSHIIAGIAQWHHHYWYSGRHRQFQDSRYRPVAGRPPRRSG
ncbi:Inner membrane protein yccF [Serratia fonticola]|uniref:Inner membrane protein yccF n=1 Tax=Serratia fonticola TaxID=47917 RepID=A0A4U9V323_SERFO|nr:Inner membrane protein yccF [Serratia fonticola]